MTQSSFGAPLGAFDLAVAAAREAGALLRDRVSTELIVAHKGTIDLVTDVDRASEAMIVARLRDAYPEHRIVAEEGTGKEAAKRDGFGWVIDPLDGTTNYAHGYPHFAVSIALECDGVPLVGVVYDPTRDELFAAERGRGATLNGTPLHVSQTDLLIHALLATGFPYDLSQRQASDALWLAFNGQAQGVRRGGSAALDLCYVAAGRTDGYWERPLNAWDMAAGVLLVTEAGGKVTSLNGVPHDIHDDQALATNGRIHREMTEIIRATLDALQTR
jgi:myo-inositol-1(or 4)-monophosphatase